MIERQDGFVFHGAVRSADIGEESETVINALQQEIALCRECVAKKFNLELPT